MEMDFSKVAAKSRTNLGFVRLHSEVDDTFVHAANDGSSVRLHECQDSYSTIWAMEELIYGPGTRYVLFRGAYGRYLGAVRRRWFPQPGVIASQRDFDEPSLEAIIWQPRNSKNRVGHLMCARGDLLRNSKLTSESALWKVDSVPQSQARPERMIHEKPKGVMKLVAWLHWWYSSGRKINWVLAENGGKISEDFWGHFVFTGWDASELEKQIRELVSAPTTICIRAGTRGKPTPLCIGFPNSQEPLNVVLYLNGTPGCAKLKFPDVSHRFGEHEMTGRVLSSEAAADAPVSEESSLLGGNDSRSC